MEKILVDSNNNITVIDFDECEYSWFACDLAICMRCYLFNDGKPLELSQLLGQEELFNNMEKILFDMNLNRILNNKSFLKFDMKKSEKLLL